MKLSNKFLWIFLLLFGINFINHAQEINLNWQPREDLNVLLPASVRIYEANGFLPDSARIRAVYASVDLRDENLKLRALGSNTHRQTTEEAYFKNDGILAINGGYFSNNASVSLLISDGEIISPGLINENVRGGFSMIEGEPNIIWTKPNEASIPLKYPNPDSNLTTDLEADQAVGGGPVLIKNGKINVASVLEGFGGSHLMRHPRTAIGYENKDKLMLMVVDGRQETSAGATLPELAQLMKSVGAVEAVNLDGGGSSAMVAADEIVNIPVDIAGGNRHSLRNNASALILSEIIPSEEDEVFYFDTEDSNYSENGLWKATNLVNYYGKTPSRTASAGLNYNKAKYLFDSIPRKHYQLAAWWTVNNETNADTVSYILHHGGKSERIIVDQTALSTRGKWNILGNFIIGTNDYLEITGIGDGGNLTADAIRLVALKNTPPLPVRGDLRVAVISDLNSGLGAEDYEWQVDSIINRIPRIWNPDLVLIAGDMVAGMGISDSLILKKMWAGFNEHIARPLQEANIPFAFTLGNHDGPRSYPLEQKMARKYWQDPENIPDLQFIDRENFPNYYSFMMGGSFFVSWEASSPEITPENLKWLEEQFLKPVAKNAGFRFVIGHMPLYSVAQERDSKGNVLANHKKLQELLENYNVHTYISGHQHAFYPGKNGDLHLLNAGAAGSGPRSWLTQERKPVNSFTIMDIFYDPQEIVNSTYEIKEMNAEKMPFFDVQSLPSAMFGINGHIIREDIPIANIGYGEFSALNSVQNSQETGKGSATAEFMGDKLLIIGHYFGLKGNLIKQQPIALFKGRNTEKGEFLSELKVSPKGKRLGTLKGKLPGSQELKELLSVGALFISLKTTEGEIRTQLYPGNNQAPPTPNISSHNDRNVYAVRDLEALHEINWEMGRTEDGDFISYTYQLAKDPAFLNLVSQEKTGRTAYLKKTEKDWFELLGNASEGEALVFYHRVIASDGKNTSASPTKAFKLMKTSEPLTDFIEVPAPKYEFKGKIENAEGGGYGAAWDKQGKLWLADYRGSLVVLKKDGTEADFSPIRQIEVNGKKYDLSPVSGMGIGAAGDILVGNNKNLLKINSSTGKGIAVWTVPEGMRSLTSPRATQKGEIYAMSLFAEDGNYVLKQSETDPSTFELLRTIVLKDRILSRSFDMSRDGKTLYFPDPGSPLIQKFESKDGITYKKAKDISSTASGSSAVQIMDNGNFYAAVRASGISPSSIHFRSEKDQKMWTLELPEVGGAEPRGIGVSPDEKTIIFAAWDKGGGFYKYELKQ